MRAWCVKSMHTFFYDSILPYMAVCVCVGLVTWTVQQPNEEI